MRTCAGCPITSCGVTDPRPVLAQDLVDLRLESSPRVLGEVLLREDAHGHAVEQRFKQMVVSAIDERYLDVRIVKPIHRVEPSEAAPITTTRCRSAILLSPLLSLLG